MAKKYTFRWLDKICITQPLALILKIKGSNSTKKRLNQTNLKN